MFKVRKKDTRTTSNIFKVHNKRTRTTSGAFIVNLNMSGAAIVNLNIFYTLFYCCCC